MRKEKRCEAMREAHKVSPGACLFNFPSTPKRQKFRNVRNTRSSSAPLQENPTSLRQPPVDKSPGGAWHVENEMFVKSEADFSVEAEVKHFHDLEWTKRRPGLHSANFTITADESEGFLRFEPLARLGIKHNRMDFVSGTVLEGKVTLRSGKTANEVRFDSPFPYNFEMGAFDEFYIPSGVYYSFQAGLNGAILKYRNKKS